MIVVWILVAVVAVASAILVVTQDNPVHSALCLVLTLLAISVMYALLNAPFLAIVQVAVYAGAIMVLFLFVIMLLNLGREEGAAKSSGPAMISSVFLALIVLITLCVSISNVPEGSPGFPTVNKVPFNADTFGSPQHIGDALFHTYLIPFEATSLLLTVAMVGAILLARRKF